MAEELAQFVIRAREKGNDDAAIRTMLLSAGWPAPQVEAALTGLDVPLAPSAASSAPVVVAQTAAAGPPAGGRASIGALEAALQHILLWLFTGTATTGIFMLVFALLAGEITLKAWFVSLVVAVVAFAPFAVLYFKYIREQTRTPELRTGKVWSIITVVLHSIGGLSSLAGLIIALIAAHGQTRLGLGLSFGLTLIVNLAVVAGYTAANFGPLQWRGRSLTLRLLPLILLLVIIGLLTASFLSVGAADKNNNTQEKLVTAVTAVRDYAAVNNKLPATLSATNASGVEGITYHKLTTNSYDVCGDFASNMSNPSYYTNSSSNSNYVRSDSYVSKSQFASTAKGRNCFTFRNSRLYYNSSIWNELQAQDSTDDSSLYEN